MCLILAKIEERQSPILFDLVSCDYAAPQKAPHTAHRHMCTARYHIVDTFTAYSSSAYTPSFADIEGRRGLSIYVADDDGGHGSHVAGSVGGSIYEGWAGPNDCPGGVENANASQTVMSCVGKCLAPADMTAFAEDNSFDLDALCPEVCFYSGTMSRLALASLTLFPTTASYNTNFLLLMLIAERTSSYHSLSAISFGKKSACPTIARRLSRMPEALPTGHGSPSSMSGRRRYLIRSLGAPCGRRREEPGRGCTRRHGVIRMNRALWTMRRFRLIRGRMR